MIDMSDHSEDYDGWSCPTGVAMLTAATPVRCDECGRVIAVGERYEDVRLLDGGREASGPSTCTDCLSIRKAFFCAHIYGSVREDLREMLRETGARDFPFALLAELTPAAREWVCGLIEATWAELAADEPGGLA
jgi:DNA-directed RNA polymerase subunit N (RpoN/RPB10)